MAIIDRTYIIGEKYWMPYINNGSSQALKYTGITLKSELGGTMYDWHRFEYWNNPDKKMTLPNIEGSLLDMIVSEDQRMIEEVVK
jgi:hypothetical protein